MSPIEIGIVGVIALFVFMLLGMPIGLSMGLIGFLGLVFIGGPEAALVRLGLTPFSSTNSYIISLLPLFTLMGEFAFASGITRDAYYTGYKWIGHLPGGLAMATIGGCAAFAAVCGSSIATSATMGSALLAKKDFPGKDITIIDTLAAHAPLGLIVLKAAQMNSEDISKDEIVTKVNQMINKVKAFILPKTLENLKRGGRIGKARGLLASLLDIKPILTLTPDGHIGIFKTTRRWSKAKRIAVESIGDFITGNKDLIVSLSDANATADVEEVEAEIRALYNPKEIMKVKIGIVVGTHVGTGIGITFYEE